MLRLLSMFCWPTRSPRKTTPVHWNPGRLLSGRFRARGVTITVDSGTGSDHKFGDAKRRVFSTAGGVSSWSVSEYHGATPSAGEIRWQSLGSTQCGEVSIDRYLLRHSRYLEMPLLWIHRNDHRRRPALLWLGENGKATAQDWPELTKYLDSGYDVVSIDPRGLGETRMPYKAVSSDDPALAQMDFDQGYVSSLSGVLADYVYNSILTGRPYFLQMIEDVEIASRFVHAQLSSEPDFFVTGSANGYTIEGAVSEILTGATVLPRPDAQNIKWSELVDQKRDLWPIQFLLPGGAYVH